MNSYFLSMTTCLIYSYTVLVNMLTIDNISEESLQKLFLYVAYFVINRSELNSEC